MVLNKLNKWIILFLIAIIYSLFVVVLKSFAILTELTVIFLFSISPIILVNIYFIFEKEGSNKFKIFLPAFSSIFIILYCYVFLFLMPYRYSLIKKFNDEEFGIFVYCNIEKELETCIDIKQIMKKLKDIKFKSLRIKKSIRVEKLDQIEKPNSEYDFNDQVQKTMMELNASAAITIQKIIGDSIYSRIYSTSKFTEYGLPKTIFNIISSPIKLADILKDNIEALLAITNTDSIENVEPVTVVAKAKISNLYYERSTIILDKVFDNSENLAERQAKVKQAEIILKKSIELDSSNDKSLALLAYIKNIEESKHDIAAAYYEKAKQLQPKNYAYTWNLAQSYYLAEEVDKAINILDNYLKDYGESIEDKSQKWEMEKLLKSYMEAR